MKAKVSWAAVFCCVAGGSAYAAQCNNTPVGQGITCVASANNRAGGSSAAVTFGNGYAAGSTVIVAVSELNPQLWRPNWTYPVGSPLLDSNGNIQIVSTGGVSGATAPAWNQSDTTTDHTVTWTFVRKGRLDPSWLSSDISNTAGFHWNFWKSYASGVEDANVVQIALYYAVAPATSTLPDTITVHNPDGTYTWQYAVVYSGLGATNLVSLHHLTSSVNTRDCRSCRTALSGTINSPAIRFL